MPRQIQALRPVRLFAMRDLIVLLGFLGVVPIIFLYAYVGALAWALLSIWNIHRLAWGGFAQTFPYAVAIGGATLAAFVMQPKERRPLYWTAPLVMMTVMVIWMNITTVFAMYPEDAMELYKKFMKIILMTYITAFLIHTKGRVLALLAILTWSIAFYTTKGGVFTILTGGHFSVVGPYKTFIDSNTTMAMAGIMTLPYMAFWRRYLSNVWAQRGMLAAMLFSFFAIVGSYSRGAFLALGAMAFFLWLKSEKKGITMVALLVLLPVVVGFMPDKYMSRMNTIETYDQDASAMGRVNAWWMAFNLANDHPIVGGGFDSFNGDSFAKWAPIPGDVHDSHSNYFQMLGHHGYVGLIIFLGMGLAHWFACISIIRKTRNREDLRWAHDIAAMTQVSIIGYSVAGAFLGAAYYDYYYFQLVLIVNLQRLVDEALEQPEVVPGEEGVASVQPKPFVRGPGWKPTMTPGATQTPNNEPAFERGPEEERKFSPNADSLAKLEKPGTTPTMRPGGSVRRDVVKAPKQVDFHHGAALNKRNA